MCQQRKPVGEFYRHPSSADGLKPMCRGCYTEYNRARREARYAEFREWLWAKKSEPCADCGGTFHPAAMQFDHLPGKVKLFEVATGVASRSRVSVLAEIAKCELVCANCHAIRTHERRQS